MSEDWNFYLAKVDHKPASIMVDLGIKQELPYPRHSFMVYLRIRMENPRHDGLSSNEEFDKLCEIGDSVESLVKDTEHLYVGRNTSDGNRDFYFYTPDPAELLTNISNMMLKFESYDFRVGHREDVNWDSYRNFLYPDWKAKQRIMNRQVCDSLQDNGDNNSIPRKIDHWVYVNSSKDMNAYIAYLESQNFSILKSGREKVFKSKRFINFERVDIPAEIDELTIELCEKAAQHNGEYDGWGCTVVIEK